MCTETSFVVKLQGKRTEQNKKRPGSKADLLLATHYPDIKLSEVGRATKTTGQSARKRNLFARDSGSLGHSLHPGSGLMLDALK